MLEGLLGFSGGPSLFGRLIDGFIIACLVVCAIKCFRAMCCAGEDRLC